jgi:hypothetical protein
MLSMQWCIYLSVDRRFHVFVAFLALLPYYLATRDIDVNVDVGSRVHVRSRLA